MKRQWLVIPDDGEAEVVQIDVVQGIEIDGVQFHHGHKIGRDCDCRPQIIPNVDTLIIVHKPDC